MKKTTVLISVALAFVFGFASCKDKLEIDDSGNRITPCFNIIGADSLAPGLPVEFVNCSQNTVDFLWDFGDGTTSSEVNPIHQFQNEGRFTVTLTGEVGLISKSITKEVIVEFPRFKIIRLLQVPIINPSDGLPWDDGSGLSAFLGIKYDGYPGHLAFGTPWLYNLTLPFDFVVDENISINRAGWQIHLTARQANPDTLADVWLLFDQIIDTPIKRIDIGDSVVLELYTGAW